MLFVTIAAAGLYLLIAIQQLRRIARQDAVNLTRFVSLSAIALVLHAVAAISAANSADGLNLGLFKVAALIFVVINSAFLLSLLWRPLHNLAVVLFPLAALSLLVAYLAPGNLSPLNDVAGGLRLHIGSSILAYAVLTLAALQAVAVAIQDRQLRHRHTRGLVRMLPPLELMETMLFELIWFGLALLTLSIASGTLFIDDMFAQNVAHKTILTLCAWMVFAVLLWGRHQLGWRSQTAVRFTLTGFAVLMLAFFGSKLVLELILQRV